MDQAQEFCKNHPNRATTLHCNRCGLPICSQCAVLTPVGYRCKECVREQQKIYETALWFDFLIAFLVAGILIGAGSLLSNFIGFFAILVAALAGTVAARAIQAAVRHRRSRYLWLAAGVGGILACLPSILLFGIGSLLAIFSGSLQSLTGALFILIWPVAYLVISVGVMCAELRGTRFW